MGSNLVLKFVNLDIDKRQNQAKITDYIITISGREKGVVTVRGLISNLEY